MKKDIHKATVSFTVFTNDSVIGLKHDEIAAMISSHLRGGECIVGNLVFDAKVLTGKIAVKEIEKYGDINILGIDSEGNESCDGVNDDVNDGVFDYLNEED